MNKGAAREERETTLTMFDGKAHVWTSSLPVYNRLVKLGWTLKEDHEQSAWFEAPDRCVSFRRNGPKANRPISESAKKAVARRFKQARESRLAHSKQ